MTPERAREIVLHNEPVFVQHLIGNMTHAILAACVEERRAALTEAEIACLAQRVNARFAVDYNDGCRDCARAIERLRDQPEQKT